MKPFYRGSKVTLIGAITQDKVLALMTIDSSLDTAAFKVFRAGCISVEARQDLGFKPFSTQQVQGKPPQGVKKHALT